MNPGGGVGKWFTGCTPEQLFQVRGEERIIIFEALTGTRPRGSTSEDDAGFARLDTVRKRQKGECDHYNSSKELMNV
jgi:anthranilate/para-aminobenzoate synthase component I